MLQIRSRSLILLGGKSHRAFRSGCKETRDDIRAALQRVMVLLNDAHQLPHLSSILFCADDRSPQLEPSLQDLQPN
jgi:hypothetical protein